MLTPEALVRALRTVPEKHLRLVELAWELAREDGTLDVERSVERAEEVQAAVREASVYVQATRSVLRCLIELAR